MSEIVVLGAGIAGISAAYHLKPNGLQVSVFEAQDSPGGLLDNFEIDGFRFDNAIHLSFTKNEYVRSLFDQIPFYRHNPESWCFYDGYWLKHPVQNNLNPLPLDTRLDLIEGMLTANQLEVNNYEDWLISQYGEKFAKEFPIPYTEKYWTIPAKRMSTTWIGDRVRKLNIREVLRGAITSDTPNHYYAQEMRYPVQGGYKSFIQPLIDETEISCGKRATLLDTQSKTIEFSDGSKIKYEKLISTIPITELVKICKSVPSSVKDAANSLWATSIDLVSIGFSMPNVSPYLWFYIYGDDIPAARAYSPNVKSPNNVPEGCSALQFEVYSSPHRPLPMSSDGLKNLLVDFVIRAGLASNDSIRFVHHKRLPFANVVFDIGMEKKRQIVRDFFERNSIKLAGRFGEWEYYWSDQSLLSGKRAADACL